MRFLFVLLHFRSLIFLGFENFGEGVDFCFDGSKEGYRLKSEVIKSVRAQSGVDCITQCLTHDKSCRSVNFRKSSVSDEKENCELLYAVHSEEPSSHFCEDKDFDHYILRQPNRASLVTKHSCEELLKEDPNLQSGIYHLQARSSPQKYPVYCHMNDIPGCGGGNWTIVMKTDGTKPTFKYDSPYWTNKETYAVEDGLEGLTEKESKLASYWNTPFKKICLGMTVNGDRKWMVLDYEASSLYSLIADSKFRATTAGRQAWKSLISGSSLQPHCNREGFGIFESRELKMRLGYMANNHNYCPNSDSCIGFGIFYRGCDMDIDITCGNIAQCSNNDNGKKMTAAFGYILVR